MIKIQKPEPKAFRGIPHSNQVDLLVKHFIDLCTNEPLFIGTKICSAYFKLRGYFKSEPITEICVLWDYLYSLKRREVMSLTTAYRQAELHRKNLIAEANQRKLAELNVEKQEEITLDDVMKI